MIHQISETITITISSISASINITLQNITCRINLLQFNRTTFYFYINFLKYIFFINAMSNRSLNNFNNKNFVITSKLSTFSLAGFWLSLTINGNFANFLAEGVDVLLQGDVLQEGVLQHCLQLLVDLQAELQRHGGVAHLAVVQTRHYPRTGSHLGLENRK